MLKGLDECGNLQKVQAVYCGQNISVGKILTKKEGEAGMQRVSPGGLNH